MFQSTLSGPGTGKRRRSRPLLLICLALAWAFMPTAIQPCQAQLFGSKQASSEFGKTLLPNNAFAAIVVAPKDILKNPALSGFPREIVTAAGNQQLGFDPMLVEQLTLVFTHGEDSSDPPQFAMVMQFSELQGLAGAMIKDYQKKTVLGKTAYINPNEYSSEPSFLVFDESTIVVGEAEMFESLINNRKGKLAELYTSRKLKGQAMAFIDIQSLRPIFAELFDDLEKQSAPLEDLKELPDLINSIEVAGTTSERIQLDIQMMAVSPDAAAEAREIIVKAIKYAHALLISELQGSMDMSDPVQAATVQYADRVWRKYEPKMIPEVSGSALKMTFHEEVLAMPFLVGLLGSRVEQAIQPRYSPETQARQIALGILNYESAYRKFPPHTVRDENGKALFSGRVAILPFIEQNVIHENLKLDEPWNSRHNSEFTKMEVQVFADLEGTGKIKLPVFPGSIWDSETGIRIGEITDGTSNTILAIQAPPEDDASWADPNPWKISASNPMRDVFGKRDRVLVVMVDGSTKVLKKSEMTNEKLKAMLTRNGGEIIE